MAKNNFSKISKDELLQMLRDQELEIQRLEERNQLLTTENELLRGQGGSLNQVQPQYGEFGSLAESALQLNGVFAAAQAAADQYISEIRSLHERLKNVLKKQEAKLPPDTEAIR